MSWSPTKAQLATIIDFQTARMSAHRIARALGIDVATFLAWAQSLARGREFGEAEDAAAWAAQEAARPAKIIDEGPKIRAARLFDMPAASA